MRSRLLPALFAALLLGGCVEAEEAWELRSDGGGTWTLTLTWDADLVQRLVQAVGPDVARRFEGRPFPMTEAAWRDAVEGVDGVEVERLESRPGEAGRTGLFVRLAFQRLEDLLRVEPIGRRGLETGLEPAEGADAASRTEDRAAPGDTARWTMHPFDRLPALDAVAAALGLLAPDRPPGGPGPADLGLSPRDADLLARILRPHLGGVRLTTRVRVPGRLLEVGDQPARRDAEEAVVRLGWDDLASGHDRTVRLAWAPRLYDRVPTIRHRGDAPVR